MKRSALLFLSAVTALVFVALPSLDAAEPDRAKAVLSAPRDAMPNILAKLHEGKEVNVAYFGGSITAQNGWRPKTLGWLRKRFPEAKINEINATIGGTGSTLGVFRFDKDVLAKNPDLIFLEFTVNDGGTPPEQIYRAVEGIVRKAWAKNPQIDFCFVYTFRVGFEKDLDEGLCPRSQTAHERIAEYYGIPSINPSLRVAELAKEGKLVFKGDPKSEKEKIVFSADGVHPLDAGHEVYLDVVGNAIAAMDTQADAKPHSLPEPFRKDNWQDARLVPISEKMLHGNWRKMGEDDALFRRFRHRLGELWLGSRPGDSLELTFDGTMVGLYDLVGPDGGQLRWEIDGKEFGPRPRFDSYCTYHRLAAAWLDRDLPSGTHSVKVWIDAEQPDRESVLKRVRDKPGFDAKKYDGTNAWIGYWMILGTPASDH